MTDSSDFDEVEMQVLALIANLSLEAGGKSIFGARTLLGGDFNNMESKILVNEIYKSTPNEIFIYPNPNSGIINFKLTQACEMFRFEIYDVLGKVILGRNFNGIDAASGLNVSHLSQGSYIYKIIQEKGVMQNGLLIITK